MNQKRNCCGHSYLNVAYRHTPHFPEKSERIPGELTLQFFMVILVHYSDHSTLLPIAADLLSKLPHAAFVIV